MSGNRSYWWNFLLISLILVSCTTQPGQATLLPNPAVTSVPETATFTPVATARIILGDPATPNPAAQAASLPATAPVAQAAPVKPVALVPPPQPVSLPPGFAISVFAQGLSSPRMLAIGPDGQLYVADTGNNRIVRLPDLNHRGVADQVQVVADNLFAPNSVAFYKDGSLYVGETTRILRLSAPDANGVFQQRQVLVQGLPSGDHNTRTILFSPDWSTMYVAIGSSCNVCIESDPRRATIMRYDPNGGAGQVFASGIRNAVGITFRPGTDELWATVNGRDYMGEDQPPDTIILAQQGQNYGWPRCQAGNIIDPQFGGPGACQGVAQPEVRLQAHSAPLGLAFYTGAQFPVQYRGGLFVAYHGSWNRTVPTGYKLVFIPFQDGKPGPVQDFATGWLANGSDWGRPVDVINAPDGSLFVSDDAAGLIYRIIYVGG